MEAAARMRLAALAVLLAVLVPLVVIAVSSGGGADGGTLDPHVHLAMAATVVDRVARCRLRDTDPPLEGRLI